MNSLTPTILMKSTKAPILFVVALLSSGLTLPLAAQGPGRGGRRSGQGGGRGPGGGGPGGFQDAIHTLFENHSKIKRSVEVTATGYKSRTVSEDPEIAKTLQKHVREMRERLGSGLMIRRWDPAFAELVAHYGDIDHEFKEIDGGVEMVASGKTPEAVKVAQNHARIVSGFVEKGPAQMHEKHAPALTGDGKDATPTSDPKTTAADQDQVGPEGRGLESKPCCNKPAEKADSAGTPETSEPAKEAAPSDPPCCRAKEGAKPDPKNPAR